MRWSAAEIKSELKRCYGPITRLSLAWGYSRNAITLTLSQATFSMPVERRIAAALDVTPHELWPDRWTAGDEPMPRWPGHRPRNRINQPQKHGVA